MADTIRDRADYFRHLESRLLKLTKNGPGLPAGRSSLNEIDLPVRAKESTIAEFCMGVVYLTE